MGARQKSLIDLREAELGDFLRAEVNAYLSMQRRELMNLLPDLESRFNQEVLETNRVPSRQTVKDLAQEAFSSVVSGK